MSTSDKSQKTEKPTSHRRREAKKKGQVPKSQEVGVAASFVVALISLRVFGPSIARTVLTDAQVLIGSAGNGPELSAVFGVAGGMFAAGVVPVLALAVGIGLAAAVGQVGFLIAPEAAKPKLENLSPKRGLERLKPAVATWELTRTVLKLGLFAAVAWAPVSEGITALAGTRQIDRALADVSSTIWGVLLRAAMLSLLIAGSDYLFNRWRTAKSMKMSKDEIRREHKNQEGDPLVRGQRRRRAAEMSRNRIINVATADVIVTNPTHFAVALAYSPPDPAPRVVAKGTDRQAKRIRRMAARHAVPIVENRPLARSLYRRVKVGAFVPGALFEAVAIVLAEAYRRSGRRRTA